MTIKQLSITKKKYQIQAENKLCTVTPDHKQTGQEGYDGKARTGYQGEQGELHK